MNHDYKMEPENRQEANALENAEANEERALSAETEIAQRMGITLEQLRAGERTLAANDKAAAELGRYLAAKDEVMECLRAFVFAHDHGTWTHIALADARKLLSRIEGGTP